MFQAAMRYQVPGLKELAEEKLIEDLVTVRGPGTITMFDPKLQAVMLPELQECMCTLVKCPAFAKLLLNHPRFGLNIITAEYAPGYKPIIEESINDIFLQMPNHGGRASRLGRIAQ